MTQNRSSAVMQQRAEPHDSLDDFPTPPWATRALCHWLMDQGFDLGGASCAEPAANRGHMVRPLREFFAHVEAADIHDYGAGFPVNDYLTWPLSIVKVDWTITNPPFRLAEAFVRRAIDSSRIGAAFLVRSAFLECEGRHRSLFATSPPAWVLQFVERVVIHRGRLAPKGSSATAYSWLVWLRGENDTRLRWIAPCRRALERPGDYPPEPTAAAPAPLIEQIDHDAL